MTVEEAIAATRAKWNHSPVDLRDVEERIAMRAVDAEVLVHAPQSHCPAVRIFVRHPKGWRSRYVHCVEDVDAVLDWCLGVWGRSPAGLSPAAPVATDVLLGRSTPGASRATNYSSDRR